MSVFKRPLVLIGAVLLLLLGGLVIAPFLIPTDVYRTQIEKAASQAIDRKVTLDEDVSLSLLPRLSARVGGVEIANPEGFSRANMLTAGELRGVVRWAPLLAGRVEISEFVFDGADLKLERLESGKANWEFATGAPGEQGSDEPAGNAPAASVDTARLTNATVVFEDAMNNIRHEVSDLNIMARMADLDAPLKVEASGVYEGESFRADLDVASVNALTGGEPTALALAAGFMGAELGFDGTLSAGDTVAVDGRFEAEIAALPPLLGLAGIDPGYDLGPIGRIRAAGALAGPAEALRISELSLRTEGEGLESRFDGGLALGETVTVEGELALGSDNLGAVLTRMGVELPVGADVFEALDARMRIAGPLEALSLSGIDITHRGALLSAEFAGALGLAGDGSIDGSLSASSEALRALAAALGSPLPEGEAMQSFDLSADLEGNFSSFRATGLEARLDETVATGTASVDVSGERPSVSADLVIPRLALDAFLVESEEAPPEGQAPGGWSDAAIDLAALETVDVDLQLRSERVSLGEIVLSNANLDTRIDDGRLTAAIREAGLFGGQWRGEVSLDGSGQVPGATIALTGEAVAVDNALATLAGLDSLGGLGAISLDFDTRGATVADMVAGLSGTLGADLADGRIKGLNVGQLVRSRDNIIAALADGSLAVALSPEAETDFTSFDAEIRFDKGVGQVNALSFRNPLVLFDGSGRIDLPGQTLDLSINPKVDEAGGGQGTKMLGVDGIPIPIRLSGSWFSPKVTPDTRLLQQQLQQSALDEVRSRASDELGGEAGAILDRVLGQGDGREQDPGTADSGSDAAPGADASPPPPASAEEAVEGLVRERLGGLFGRSEPAEEDGPDER